MRALACRLVAPQCDLRGDHGGGLRRAAVLQELAEPPCDLLVLERVASEELDVPLEQVGAALNWAPACL